MKLKSVLFIAMSICIGVITSCEKNGTTEDSLLGTVYVIDTTQKTTINEIIYLEDYDMIAGSGKWWGVDYNNGRWVVVGSSSGFGAGYITTSINGTNWSSQTVGSNGWWSVGYGNGVWVAVGGKNGTETIIGRIATSADGINWTIKSETTGYAFSCAKYANGRWIIAGALGGIATSTDDANNWHTQTIGSNNWHGIAYNNGRWVVVGGHEAKGYTATSTDGINWSIQALGSIYWRDIEYGNEQWVAVGEGGRIATSTDGTNWTTQTVGSNHWYGIAYNNAWITVGGEGKIATSTDGTNWTTQTVASNTLRSVAIKTD
jgi:hypothetical protein